MTVATSAASVVAQGNGVTTVFNFGFIIPYEEDGITPACEVWFTPASGVPQLLAPSTYTIAGVGQQLGGTVTYNPSGTPIPVGTWLGIIRTVPLTQPDAFPNQGFYPESVEAGLDNLEEQLQQLNDEFSRTLVVPFGVPLTPIEYIEELIGQVTVGLSTAIFASTDIMLSAISEVIPGGTTVLTGSRTTPGDCGGALFWYSATDTTTADNGGTIRVDTHGRRWYAVLPNGDINVGIFGAAPNTSTDLGPPLILAVTYALSLGGAKLIIPPGSYTGATNKSFDLTATGATPSAEYTGLTIIAEGVSVIVPSSLTGYWLTIKSTNASAYYAFPMLDFQGINISNGPMIPDNLPRSTNGAFRLQSTNSIIFRNCSARNFTYMPTQTEAVTGAAGSGGLVRLAIATTTGLKTGDMTVVSGVVGTTEANGTWPITVVNGTHIDLVGSTFANAYVSGGSTVTDIPRGDQGTMFYRTTAVGAGLSENNTFENCWSANNQAAEVIAGTGSVARSNWHNPFIAMDKKSAVGFWWDDGVVPYDGLYENIKGNNSGLAVFSLGSGDFAYGTTIRGLKIETNGGLNQSVIRLRGDQSGAFLPSLLDVSPDTNSGIPVWANAVGAAIDPAAGGYPATYDYAQRNIKVFGGLVTPSIANDIIGTVTSSGGGSVTSSPLLINGGVGSILLAGTGANGTDAWMDRVTFWDFTYAAQEVVLKEVGTPPARTYGFSGRGLTVTTDNTGTAQVYALTVCAMFNAAGLVP